MPRSLQKKPLGTQKQADEIFSKYIRQKDVNHQGLIKCCSCGVLLPWEDSDASHFVSRQYLATRYDERNVHASCRKCNRFLEGRKEEYALFLIKRYGVEVIEELNEEKWKPIYAFDYRKVIEDYREKIKQL